MVDIGDMKLKDVSLDTLKQFLASKEEEKQEEFSLKTAKVEEYDYNIDVYNNQDKRLARIFRKVWIKEFGYFGWFYKEDLPEGYEPKLVDDGFYINILLVKTKKGKGEIKKWKI